MEDLTKELYTEYCRAVGGRAFNNDPLPTWEEFKADPKKQVQVAGWYAISRRAHQLLLRSA